jgi:hypothetical protein
VIDDGVVVERESFPTQSHAGADTAMGGIAHSRADTQALQFAARSQIARAGVALCGDLGRQPFAVHHADQNFP